jgi:hypothetical protein
VSRRLSICVARLCATPELLGSVDSVVGGGAHGAL